MSQSKFKIVFGINLSVAFAIISSIALFANGFKSIEEFIGFFTNQATPGYPQMKEHRIIYPNNGKSDFMVDSLTMRRKTRPDSENHIFLIGGSNLLGWKISEENTIFNKLSSKSEFAYFDILNLAYPGWGAGNLLERLEGLDLKNITNTSRGILIYLFSDVHFERTCGGDFYYSWAKNSPHYSLENQQLTKSGYIKYSSDYILFKIKNGFNKIKSGITGKTYRLDVNLDFAKDQNCIELHRQILKKIKTIYLTSYPQSKFYIFNITFSDDTNYKNIFEDITDGYFNLQKYIHDKDMYLQEDSHVNEEFNELFVHKLVDLINQL